MMLSCAKKILISFPGSLASQKAGCRLIVYAEFQAFRAPAPPPDRAGLYLLRCAPSIGTLMEK
ncbi:hypothetical protein Q675_13330 [Labrenzia sp. C1B70]|nr:hypothetical protein Q675_13330 [Labrenzia sp. C1B70]